ncbi:MAG: hypothetical protein ACI835_005915 [Planctomycetota bacterium]|jgi:hypothetical protein
MESAQNSSRSLVRDESEATNLRPNRLCGIFGWGGLDASAGAFTLRSDSFTNACKTRF